MPRGKAFVDDRARAWRRFEAHPWRITVTRSHALAFTSLLAYSPLALAQEAHSHAAPEKLGAVEFATTCKPSVQPAFERGVALLHSFAYAAADAQFREVAAADPDCAIAHWGIAMASYHPLWDAPGAAEVAKGAAELGTARERAPKSEREREFIDAASAFFADPATPHAERAKAYEIAMADVARRNPDDSEAQIFYALALISTASPTDRTHANQKHAIAILEPLHARYPQHPGIAHYLIHACDSAELAPSGLDAARAYSKIAPSAPHALHMPSHIFTRLGYWEESIASNRAARAAAESEGDIGEALHAMDYMTYAYLQLGKNGDAERVVADLHGMEVLAAGKFKIGYAANAMPVRIAIEQRRWNAAAKLEPLPGSEPHVAAIVYWARAVGHSRSGRPDSAAADIAKIDEDLAALRAKNDPYWTTQTEVLAGSARAWQLAANGKTGEAIAALRVAADAEDAIEKRPVTPGPIVPAREQLGDLLLERGRADDALREFKAALAESPMRRGALTGAARAAELAGDIATAKAMRAQLGSAPSGSDG
jgi:tetratricopeptide (TPR) repeat protein